MSVKRVCLLSDKKVFYPLKGDSGLDFIIDKKKLLINRPKLYGCLRTSYHVLHRKKVMGPCKDKVKKINGWRLKPGKIKAEIRYKKLTNKCIKYLLL